MYDAAGGGVAAARRPFESTAASRQVGRPGASEPATELAESGIAAGSGSSSAATLVAATLVACGHGAGATSGAMTRGRPSG